MNNAATSLLPSGFFDLLPPDARQQRILFQQVLDCFAGFGYQEVSPPFMEFEASLLAGKSAALSAKTFRLMDPISHEMMGIRSDMTMQVARIASARLGDQPKPLRLCYAGTCLRVAGEGLRRERQFMQAGAELIGSDSLDADIEVLRMAISAIEPLGLGELTIDLHLPELSTCLLQELPEPLRKQCAEAIYQKDRSSLGHIGDPLVSSLVELLEITDKDLSRALSLNIPQSAKDLITQWFKRISAIKSAGIDARLTLDPLEQRGFEYYTGIAFSIFASRVESEVGRGGRYLMNDGTPAIGFTIYLNPLRHAMQPPAQERKCYMPYGTVPETSTKLRKEGWITVHALLPDENPAEAAIQQGCTHWLNGSEISALKMEESK